jgi:hypothetical protein
MSKSGRVFGEIDLDRELVALDEVYVPHAARLVHVGKRSSERAEPLGRVAHEGPIDLGA